MIDFCIRCRRLLEPDEDVWAGYGRTVRPEGSPYPELPSCKCRDDAVVRRVGFNPVRWKLTVVEI